MSRKKFLLVNEIIDRSILNDLNEYKEDRILSENNKNSELFSFPLESSDPLNEEEESLETLNQRRYFYETKTKENTSNSANQETKIKTAIFVVTKERERERENSPEFLQRIRRRGRRPNSEIQIISVENPKRKKLPRKFGRDNIITKNQDHFISYIIIVFNILLNFFGIKDEAKDIDYKIKSNSNYDNFMELRQKTLGEIISNDITKKFKKLEKNYNAELVQKIMKKNIEVINNFLNFNYLSFFRNFYYKNSKKIYLKDFGSKDDSYILLQDEKITFQDKINSFGDENYANVYKKVVEELYFPKMFSTNN